MSYDIAIIVIIMLTVIAGKSRTGNTTDASVTAGNESIMKCTNIK